MKILGLIGGTTWLSTLEYYKLINEAIQKRLGGLNSSHCIIYSFNFTDLKKYCDENNWPQVFKMVLKACEKLKSCGAEAIVLCANTLHMIADQLELKLKMPVIHIVEATTLQIKSKQLQKVGLLGTQFTMEENFFKSRLIEHNIDVIVPDTIDRDFIHRTIFEELAKNIFIEATKKRYIEIIRTLTQNGAQGIILGCTEISLLIHQTDISVPIFDTTKIHADAAVDFSIEN